MTDAPILGRADAGTGRLLVLIHAFPFAAAMWSEQISTLAQTRRVVAVDLRGRGKTPSTPAPWSMDSHADDLARTLDDLGVEQADFAGVSMGGYIAFALWRRHAARVRSLALIDTKPAADSPEAKQGRLDNAARARAAGTSALVSALLPKLIAPNAAPALRQRLAAMMAAIPGETYARDLLAMAERPDSTPTLSSITVPALVLRGAEDALVSHAEAAAMAAAMPASRLVEIAGVGHLAPLENPSAVNEAIASFLSTQA